MKKLFVLSFILVAGSLLNVGCTASAGIHGTNATKIDNSQQAAYVTAPAK